MEITFLQIILYVLGAVLLVTLIVLAIKLVYSVNRINSILDSVERKMRTVDKAFNAIDRVVDSLSIASDRIVDKVASLVGRVFNGKRKNKKEKENI